MTKTNDSTTTATTALQLGQQCLKEMREWIADCQWREDADELRELPDLQVLCGIEHHYAGGILQFAQDANYDISVGVTLRALVRRA